MLEEAADDRAHADALGRAGDARRQHAGAAHDQVDVGAGPRRRATSASISGTSVSALILTTMRAGAPARGRLGDLRDVGAASACAA